MTDDELNYISAIARMLRSTIDDDLLPDGPIDGLLLNYAIVVLSVGEETSARDVHNAWAAWMAAVDRNHKSLVPFESLDRATAMSDEPFAEAIRSVARELTL